MEDDQQFCLRWNNHQSTLVQNFDTLLESGTLVDCTLAAEGRYLKAHKVVLSACSPYFEGLLSEHYDKHPIFILKDVTFNELKAMMDYMYRGEVNIGQDQLTPLLKAAESLQIRGLSDNRTGESRKADTRPQKTVSQPTAPSLDIPHTSSGLTIEKNRVPRQQSMAQGSVGDIPEDTASPQVSKGISSREGSQSPIPRRRKKLRRRSAGEDTESQDASNSSDMPQQMGSGPSLGIAPVAEERVHADPTDSLGRSALMTQLTKPADEMLQLPLEKPEPSDNLVEPKSEYLEEPEEGVEDLTLDDDMNDLNEMEQDNNRAGPSHDSSQHPAGLGAWHVTGDRSNAGGVVGTVGGAPGTADEVFLAAQEAVQAHRDSQEDVPFEVVELLPPLITEPVSESYAELMSELNWQQITNLYTEIVTESRKEQVKTEKELELKTEDVDGELITEQIAEKESKLITEDVLQLTEELVTEQIAEQVTERNTEHVMELTRKVTSMNAVLEPETITGNEPCTHAKVGHQSSESNPTFKRQTCVARSLPCGASAVATQFNRPYRKCRSNIQQYLVTFRKTRATSAVDEAQHKCQKCNRTFKTKSSLYYHLQRICGREVRFKCLYCSKRTKKFGSIYAHVRKYHEGFEVCAQDIDRDCIMKLYQPRTSVNGQFKCPYCEYRANNRNYVYKHVRKFHKTSEVCALDLKMNSAVLKPGDRKMNGRDAGAEKKYQCKKCNSRFTSKSYLHRHLRYICGQEPRFKCPYCCSNNKYFNDIYGHIRKHHKDFDKHAQNMDRDCVVKPQQTLKALEAPFKCPYCNVRFKITSSIYKHIRNCHKGSKVYAYVNEDCINKPHIAKELLGSFSRCPYCKLRSMYRTSIYRHVRAVHKTKEVYALDAAGNVLKPLKHKLN